MATDSSKTRSRSNKGTSDDGQEATPSLAFTDQQSKQLSKLIGEAIAAQSSDLEANIVKRLKEEAAQGPAKKQRMDTGKDGGHGQHIISSDDSDASHDEADAYMEDLDKALDDGEKTGRDLPESIVRVFSKTVGPPVDVKLVKEKRQLYPRPGNAATLKAPALNETPSEDGSADRDSRQMEPRDTTSTSGRGDSGNGRQAKDRTANVFTSMIEYRDAYRLQNCLPPGDQHTDKVQSRLTLGTPRLQAYGLPLSNVPRSTGTGPPPRFPSSSQVFTGGTLPGRPSVRTPPPTSSAAGPSISIKRSPKVKIFQKKERTATDMLGTGGRETVIHNGLQRVTVENTPQVVYEAGPPTLSPALHRHLPNVSAHLPVSKKPTKKPPPAPSPSSTPKSSSSSTMFRSGLAMFHAQPETKPGPQAMSKMAKAATRHVPLPAHSRPTTPVQAGLMSPQPMAKVMDAPTSSDTKDVPLDLSRDTYIPAPMATMRHTKEVASAAGGAQEGDSVGDCPLDLSVKKRPHSSDSSNVMAEPALKKQAVEVAGVSGKVKFTRPVSHSDASVNHRSAAAFMGIAFGNPRVTPVGIAMATAHAQEGQVDVEGPRTPRPAHMHPAQVSGLNSQHLTDFPIPSDGRSAKDMLMVGRRSPILPGGPCTVRPSLRHSDVVTVRGKPFKVSTVRPQVNGRPVITTRSLSSAVTTAPITHHANMPPSTSNVTVNGTIGSGPLGCLQLSSVAVHNPALTAEAPGKLCELDAIKTPQGPSFVMIGPGTSGLGLRMVSTQQTTSSEVRHSAGAAESSEESESACQTPLLNIPKFKPSKAKTKSKKNSRPHLVINIPDQINTSSSSVHSSVPSVVPGEEQLKDTQCVSISTQTVNESEEDNKDDNEDSDDTDSPIIVDDFPPPDEPVDLKELYPTPSRTLMCARKSTTKQSKRLLQQILESRSPPKLSVITPKQKAPRPDSPSPPPPNMPILSPNRSPPILVPQTLPKVKRESLTSLETVKAEPDGAQGSDCDEEEAAPVVPVLREGPKAALAVHKAEGDTRLSKKAHTSSSSKKKMYGLKRTPGQASSVSINTEHSTHPKSAISLVRSNSSVSVPSKSLTPNAGCLLAKILVAEGERQLSGRNSPHVSKPPAAKSHSAAGSRTPSSVDSDSEATRCQPASRASPASSSGGNIFEKFQALASEARVNAEDADTSDELSLMCWEQMAASPPSQQLTSPTELKVAAPEKTKRPKSVEDLKDNVDALSESSEDSTNSVIVKALPKVSNVSAFMPTTKTKLMPLRCASVGEGTTNLAKRSSSPVPIEGTRFYQANCLKGSLNRSTSSPSLETLSTSKPSTPHSISRSMSSTPQPSPVSLSDDLEDWQVAHVDWQRTKLRRPAGLITIPRSAPKSTAMKRLSPEGLYDYYPSIQYGKAKACMTGASHTPVFTPIRYLSTTTAHGLARLATLDFSNHQPRSARTVAEFNRARTLSEGQKKPIEPPQIETDLDSSETWTTVKEVSPRKPGSPAAARHKESSGTLVTVLRRDRSRDDSGSSSKSPIQFQREKSSSFEQPVTFSRPTLNRSESEPIRSHSPASVSSSDSERPKLTVIYSGDGTKVKIAAQTKKKSSKSSKPEKHRRCSYTIKGDQTPPISRDPTSPQPKLSPIRLVASPPRRRKSSKKSESKTPPGSPRLTFVNSLLHVEPSSSSENQSSDKPTEETKHSLTVVIPKRPKIKMPELTPEPSQNTEKQAPLMKSDSKSPPIAALKIRVDQLPNPPKRMLSPIRINIKSPPHTVEPSPSTPKEVQSERNILYDLPTSPELSADETMFTAFVPESPVIPASDVPLKKKEKKASKKHKKDKKRDSSKEKSKLSEGKKEKKEKKIREKERDKGNVECSSGDKSSKKKAESELKKDKSEKRAESEHKKDKSEKKAESELKREKSEKRAESEQKKDKSEKRAESEHKKEKSEKRAESEHKKEKSEKRAESEHKKEKSEKRADSEHKKDKSEKKAESEHKKEKSEKKAESEHKKEKFEKRAESEHKKGKSEKRAEVPESAKEESKKGDGKDSESKKKESKEQRKSKTETVDDEKAKGKISKRVKSSHKRKLSEKRKLKLKRKGADNDGEQSKEKRDKLDRSERRKVGKKKRSGSKKSKKQIHEEKVAEEAKKPKRRSLLDQLTNSDGYVAEKNLDQRKCRDLYADPAKLGREERALLRAMMQFSEMEQSGTDSADYLSVSSDRLQTKKVETSARRKAQALTKCALKRARNRGGCTKKAKFDDFVPVILPSRTRTQAAELSRNKKEPTPTTPEKDEVKGRKQQTSGTDATPSKSSDVSSAKKKEAQTIKAPPEDDHEEQWQIMSDDQLQKPVVPVKRKRTLMSQSLTMKIHRKSILWEKYMQNEQRRGRPSKSIKQAQSSRRKGPKQAWSEAAVKEEPVLAAEAAKEELSQEEDMEAHLQPTLEDVKVKQEPLETEMLTPLLRPDLMRPDPMSAPSPAPSTSTGMSVGGTEEYWPVPECVKKMSVNQNTGETILHKAARLGYEDVARYCAQTDYLDLDARDHAGYTAMHECCSQGHLLVSTLLIEGGASVNLASCDGMRPLHDAVENDLMEMVRLLLSRGADPKLATYSGKTVLGLTKQKEMLSFLTGYFQDLNGCRQPQPEIPWGFNGSSVCEDPEEETGFPVLADPAEADPEGIDGISFEFSDSPPIQTYFLPLDPVKGAVNYVTLDDVAERLGLTREVFLKEYTSLPVQTSTPEAILAHCQCLGSNTVDRLHELAATGPLKLVEYSDVIRHLLEVDSQHLSDVHPDPELLAAGVLPWDKYTAGQCTTTGQESTPSSSHTIESQPADGDCYDWDEQFEQFYGRSGEQVASSSSEVHSAGTQPTTTSADIYRGLFHCGTEDEDEGEDELYLAAMGLDDPLENQDQGDNEKKDDQEIFFRKPY